MVGTSKAILSIGQKKQRVQLVPQIKDCNKINQITGGFSSKKGSRKAKRKRKSFKSRIEEKKIMCVLGFLILVWAIFSFK